MGIARVDPRASCRKLKAGVRCLHARFRGLQTGDGLVGVPFISKESGLTAGYLRDFPTIRTVGQYRQQSDCYCFAPVSDRPNQAR